MQRKATPATAAELGAALAMCPGRNSVQAEIDALLPTISEARARGVKWDDITRELNRVGVRRADGKPLSTNYLRATVTRAQRAADGQPTERRQTPKRPPSPAAPSAARPAAPGGGAEGGRVESFGSERKQPAGGNRAADDLAAELDAIKAADAARHPRRAAVSISDFLAGKGNDETT